MLAEFVSVYPDELFLNILARLASKMRLTNSNLTRTIFGKRVNLLIEFPSHLDELIAAMPVGHQFTADRFINDHSLYPLYQPFLRAKRAESLLNFMIKESKMIKGFARPRTGPPLDCLRFCYECVENDKKEQGEAFWHRVHQISGVYLCPDHGTVLQNSEVPFFNRLAHQVYISAEQALKEVKPCPNPFTPALYEELLKITNDAKWLLNHHNRHISWESLQDRFRIVLSDRGLATYNGMIRAPAFLAEFKAYYPAELLNFLDCTIKHEDSGEAWPVSLLKATYLSGHPFHYLMVIHFLGHTAASFFALPTEVSYFGTGPWPCLNPTCSDYQKPVIPDCQVHYRRSDTRPQATFSCACGFVYQRIGPDTGEADRFRLDHIVTYGPVWESRFRQLFTDPTVSRLEIAKQLQLGIASVGVYARRRNLSVQADTPGYEPKGNLEFETERANKRAIWSEALQSCPEATVSKLTRDPELCAVYHWLLRHDKEWYKTKKPVPKRKVYQPKYRYYSARYWQNLDLKLAERIHEVSLFLLEQQERPVLLKKTAIANQLNQYNAKLQSERFPLASRTLLTMAESYETFAIRRLEWTVRRLQEQGLSFTKNALIEASGLPSFFRQPRWAALSDQVLAHLLLQGPASPSLVHTLLSPVQKDWPLLDAEVRLLVEEAAHRLRNRAGYPTKLSMITIAVEIDRVELLLRHLEMLPQTAETLVRLTETEEIFAARVVEWIIGQDPEIDTCNYLMDFINLTGLRPYTTIPAVSKLIGEAFSAWQAQKQAGTVEPGIDWAAWDKKLAQAIRQAAATLKAQTKPLARITEKALSKIIDDAKIVEVKMRHLLLVYLDKLPETARTIEELVETHDQFRQRRLYYFAEQFRQERICPTRSDLLRRAGIRHTEVTPFIQETVSQLLATLAAFPSKRDRAGKARHERANRKERWEQIDDGLSELIEAAAREMKEQADPFVWVNKASVTTYVGKYELIRSRLDKLPKTAATLARVMETSEAFALRRIKWWEEQYRTKKLCPSRFRFISDAGIAHMLTRPSVQTAFEAALASLMRLPETQKVFWVRACKS